PGSRARMRAARRGRSARHAAHRVAGPKRWPPTREAPHRGCRMECRFAATSTKHPRECRALPCVDYPRSARVATPENVDHRQRNDAQVEPQRPVLDVVEVALNALVQVRVAAKIVDLRTPGDPGLHQVLLHVAGDFLLEALDELGT